MSQTTLTTADLADVVLEPADDGTVQPAQIGSSVSLQAALDSFQAAVEQAKQARLQHEADEAKRLRQAEALREQREARIAEAQELAGDLAGYFGEVWRLECVKPGDHKAAMENKEVAEIYCYFMNVAKEHFAHGNGHVNEDRQPFTVAEEDDQEAALWARITALRQLAQDLTMERPENGEPHRALTPREIIALMMKIGILPVEVSPVKGTPYFSLGQNSFGVAQLNELDLEQVGLLMEARNKICGISEPVVTASSPVAEVPRPDRKITAIDAVKGETGILDLNIPANGGKAHTLSLQTDGKTITVTHADNDHCWFLGKKIALSSVVNENGRLREQPVVSIPKTGNSDEENRLKTSIFKLGMTLIVGFRQTLGGEKDMPPAKFLSTETPGTSTISFTEETFDWKGDDGKVEAVFKNLTLTVSRDFAGNVALVAIVSPETAKEYPPAKSAIGKPRNGGNKFEDLPTFLKAFLRRCFRQYVG